MADYSTSLSERALRAVTCRLARIQSADGYCTDAGERVFRARRTLSDSELPVVVIWDQGESAEKSGAKYKIDLSIDVEGWVHAYTEDADDTGEALEQMKADIKRAMHPDGSDRLFDEEGEIGPLTYTGSVATSREDGGTAEGVRLSYTVTFNEGLGNPNGKESVAHDRRRF